MSGITSVRFGDVNVGDELPALQIPLDRSLIVAAALASRDFQDVHHDPEIAQAKGSQDIFMNILTTNGLVGRYVTDWTGPNAIIKSVAIRLGAPNYPGDTMTLTGTVTATHAGADGVGPGGGIVEVTIVGANQLGNHVTGTVTVALTANGGPG